MSTGQATSVGALVTRAFWVAAFFGCRSASADAGPHALNGVIAQVPEPSTLLTLAVALIACLYFALRRRNRR